MSGKRLETCRSASRLVTLEAWGCAVVGAQRVAPLRVVAHTSDEFSDSSQTELHPKPLNAVKSVLERCGDDLERLSG